MSVCEVRIPTYKREDMLRRALTCLRAQTVKDFHVVIFDDSPAGEGEAVAGEFPDLTIHYRRNPQNLGICPNLYGCFQTRAFYDADYCFCLEDDNTVRPTFIEANIAALRETGTAILLRNQFYESADGVVDETRLTMPDAFPTGLVEPKRLLTSLFSNVGLSNGGLFWRSDALSELMIGEDCPDAVMGEYLRPFAIRETIYFSNEPLATWRDNDAQSYRKLKSRMQDRLSNYRLLKCISGLRRRVLDTAYAGEGVEAIYAACDPSRWGRIDTVMAQMLSPHRPRVLSAKAYARHYMKGMLAHSMDAKPLGPRAARIVEEHLSWLQEPPARKAA